MKRFACQDVIPGCDQVFTGADDQSVLDQVIAHAAMDHGLVKPPLALVELVVATTHTFVPARGRGHLRLVGAAAREVESERGRSGESPRNLADTLAEPTTIPIQLHGDRSVVTQASGRFRRAGESGRAPVDHLEEAHRVAPAGYRHECVFYDGLDGFLAATIPFIEAGLELDQAIMVAVIEPRLSAVRRALGAAADRVELVDMADLGHNPARILPAWRDFADRAQGRAMRGIGEPIWAGRRSAELVESQLHEALLNVAVEKDTPLWLLCPYDVGALDQVVIDEALRSHPVVGHGDPGAEHFGVDHDSVEQDRADTVSTKPDSAKAVSTKSDSAEPDSAVDKVVFGGTDHLMSLFAADLPLPPGVPARLPADDPAELADGVLRFAATLGLPTQRSAKLAAAVAEIVAAGACESDRPVSVRLWRDEFALVCEVGDDAIVADPMIGRGAGFAAQPRERGIRLANELCDLVQVRSDATGTTVRIHSWL